MKAKRTPRNAVEYALYGFMEAMKMAYSDVPKCPAGDGVIIDLEHAYKLDGKYYHNRECAEIAALIEKDSK